jgi:hypothetical protein
VVVVVAAVVVVVMELFLLSYLFLFVNQDELLFCVAYHFWKYLFKRSFELQNIL